MTMSIAMAAGMSSLMSINSDLQGLQAQALSGKKVNTASDGLAAFISSQTYTDRASRLSSVNSTLSENLSTIKAASTGLTSISKTMSDTLDQLKSASQTQAQVTGAGGYSTASGDSVTQAKMTFSSTTTSGSAVSVTNATSLISLNNVFLGGQKMTRGDVYTFAVNGQTKSIRIASVADTQVTPPPGDVLGSTKTPIYVKSIQDIMNVMSGMNDPTMTATTQGYLGVSSAVTGTNLTVNLALNATVAPDQSATGTLSFSSVSYATSLTNDVSAMLTANRAPGAANTTYSYDSQINGGSVGSVGQSASISGQKSTYVTGTGAVAADTRRSAAAAAYKQALTVIDQYLKEASVSGINLLNGDALNVTFNERGTSSNLQLQTTSGATASYGSVGLGLTNATGAQDFANNFATNADTTDPVTGMPLTGLQAAINKLTAAQTTIQLGMSQVGQFQNTIQNRSEFNKSIISLLNESANNLTVADMTEVSTKTASLQVQQSFAQAILSSTKQSDQSMLQLLR